MLFTNENKYEGIYNIASNNDKFELITNIHYCLYYL